MHIPGAGVNPRLVITVKRLKNWARKDKCPLKKFMRSWIQAHPTGACWPEVEIARRWLANK